MKLICFAMILLLVAVAQGWKVCTKDTECAKGECCQRLRKYPIMSRRDLEDSRPVSGTCQTYKPDGSSCGPFAKANGYCSCEPGTKCKGFKDPVSHQDKHSYRLKRGIAGGYSFKCAKK